MGLRPAETSLFFSRQDPEDPRLGEMASASEAATGEASQPSRIIQVFGWPDDEGIRLNGGRLGAAEAPDRIRRFLYKMTPPMSAAGAKLSIWDRGNLDVSAEALAERHQMARQATLEAYRRGHRVLSFGGGHDYGFPDAAAFLEHAIAQGARPAVINFDAHLDVRPVKETFHSGTPFRRLLQEFGGRFDFLEIGLQPQCNSAFHADWAKSQGAELWMAQDLQDAAAAHKRIAEWAFHRRRQPLFLSLDIDAIDSSHAPGCSQSWALGLSPQAVHAMIEALLLHLDARGLGIYEVSPPLDQDDRTSKLAALFAHQFLFAPTGDAT